MEYGLFPIWSGWISQEYSASKHKGIDVGWLSKDGANLPVRAWKSGIVIASGTDAAGAYYVVIAHENNQWSGYWHLVKDSNIAKGKVVKQGDKVGIRGNTGLSSGVHLHFLITKEGMPSSYNYNTMVSNTVNPIPLCYKLKTDDIQNASDNNQYPLPYMPTQPNTVARDTSKHQVEVLATALRVRTKPSLTGEVYCIANQGIYNVLAQKTADGYTWDEIEKDRWIATNDADGWTKDLPAKDTTDEEIKKLKEQVAELTTKVAKVTNEKLAIDKELTSTKKSLETVTKERDKFSSDLTTTKTELTNTKSELSIVKKDLTASQKEVATITKEKEKLDKDLSATKTLLDTTVQQRDEANEELKTTKTSLTEIQTRVSTVADALKALFG